MQFVDLESIKRNIEQAEVALAEAMKNLPNILIFRPFQTWRMSSCLLLKAGSELGNTFRELLVFLFFRLIFYDRISPPPLYLVQMGITICNCRYVALRKK